MKREREREGEKERKKIVFFGKADLKGGRRSGEGSERYIDLKQGKIGFSCPFLNRLLSRVFRRLLRHFDCI